MTDWTAAQDSFDVAPRFAPGYGTNDCLSNTKGAPYRPLELSRRKSLPNLPNRVIRQFGHPVSGPAGNSLGMEPARVALTGRHQSQLRGVARVLSGGHPFKVWGAIVGLDGVDMVNDETCAIGQYGARANKRLGDKLVNSTLARSPFEGKETNGKVPVCDYALSQHEDAARAVAVLHAPNAAKIRDLVASFPCKYGSPLLGSQFLGGKVLGSHRGPPQKVPWSGSVGTFAASRRAALHCTSAGSSAQ